MPLGNDPFDDNESGLDALLDETVDCYVHTVIIEVENIDPTKPPIIHDVEVRASRPLSLNNLSPEVEAEVGPWLGILSNYADFTARFGTSQTWTIIGVGITRGC